MKLQQMKQGQFFLTLPNKVVRLKGWKKGDNIELQERKGDLFLVKKESLK